MVNWFMIFNEVRVAHLYFSVLVDIRYCLFLLLYFGPHVCLAIFCLSVYSNCDGIVPLH